MIRLSIVCRILGALILCVGASMLPAAVLGAVEDDAGAKALFTAMAVAALSGGGLFIPWRTARPTNISHREGMLIVTLGWVVVAALGAFPLWHGTQLSFTDAYFESMSGFTTTGSSILTDIEALPRSLLLWRSTTHWLGGMGIIVLSLAILPFLGVGGMQLYKAEVPSPVPDKLQPRIRDTAASLWKVYVALSGIEILLLMLCGMEGFDAVCHTFGTLATGGFSTKNTSVAYYASPAIDAVITVFMLASGINFALYFQAIQGRPLALWRDPECRCFLGIVALLTAMCTWDIWTSVYPSLLESLRYAAFQVVSIITTTGFATADFESWPPLSQTLLVLCMFFGASTGSTGGGIKTMRLILLAKQSLRELFRLIHPRSVAQIKLGGKPVPADVQASVWGFFTLYALVFVTASTLLACMGQDLATAFTAVAATLGNIGPGLGTVGPAENFAHLPTAAKWLLSLCMLLGRLEIYTVLVLLVPEFWRH
ncbi:MAG: potassium uptake protein TrkH family [Desulfomicrobiaceae bacterium]|jgi:trk system potassium uptake protein TrkH|nr:potassium uptake protein TrkH family [Desulfomicrobiaceae bacterium]MBZ4685206.1 potassium uptake protein TrkH family [Desulfomicrobiaceae bacterium]MDI3492177.1 trk/ktr system potassium uptake protein [Desulfomicrobiaceae bacterium]MDK2872522.1 trk/ktr system potassium uptake protein [Desulfomicrobiaceae bacterium]